MIGSTRKIRIGIGTFDLLKGIVMITVVIGHMLSYYDLDKLIPLYPLLLLVRTFASAAMPTLFVVSGLNLKASSAGKILKKTFKTMIVPYLYVMLSVVLIFPVVHRMQYSWWPGTINETMRWFLAFLFGISKPGKTLWGYSLRVCSATWFLLALFIAHNILNLIIKIKDEKIQIFSVIICAVAGYCLGLLDFFYYCIPQGLMTVAICYLGYFIKRRKLIEQFAASGKVYAVLTVISAVFIIWGNFDLAYFQFNCVILDYVGACCTSILFLMLGVVSSDIEWKPLEGIRKIGMHSYWILCIHTVEMCCIPWLKFNKLMPENYQPLFFVIEVFLKATIILVGCIILSKLSRVRYRKRLAANGR